MTPAKLKANVGITLLVFFIVTFVTGIMLHLKKHGIIIEPRPFLKSIHWISGFIMVGLTCWHAKQFWKMFINMRQKFRMFHIDTMIVILLTFVTFATGLVKLVSPVKIPHLGLWHYALGIAMTVVIAIHLIRGVPTLIRLLKCK